MRTFEIITRSADGKYRWTYEMSLYKRPKNLFRLWKVFGWIFLLLCLFLLFISAQTNDVAPTPPHEILLLCLLLYACCVLLLTALYYLVALIRGGKKVFSYEMDEEGITRIKGVTGILTRFCDVKKITPVPKRNGISLKAGAVRRSIYVNTADYEEVLAFLRAHCLQTL